MTVEARKKVFIKTYGCQMNVYDSERMSSALAPHGYEPTDAPEDADVVVLNTCHIREKAAEKVYSELGRLAQIKDERARLGSSTMIAVAGCVAQAEGDEILARAPVVDLVVGPQSYHRLPDYLREAEAGGAGIVRIDFPEEDKFQHLPRRRGGARVSAFLTIQEGCDKFCTFCVVPYTRGAEISRPARDIVAEARQLVEDGVVELTLLGQNVNAYHGQGAGDGVVSLAGLTDLLSEIDGLERIRYTTSHPRDMSRDLIAAHGRNPKLMPYLHLPFQSGADRILSAMNRKHTGEEYLRLIEQIRAARPDIALSTDVIVGFPGESDGEFEATLELVRAVGFAQAFSFKYSARPGTPAASLEGQVPEDVKSARLQALQELLKQQQAAFNTSCVGKTLPVLFEKAGRKPGQLIGRSPYLQAVHADVAAHAIGHILQVRIDAAGANSLAGSLAGSLADGDGIAGIGGLDAGADATKLAERSVMVPS